MATKEVNSNRNLTGNCYGRRGNFLHSTFGMTTHIDQEVPQYELIIQTFLLAVLLLVLILGNSVICALVWKYRNLRTYANFLVVEMALVDLFNGVINIPLFICYQLYPSPVFRGRSLAIVCLYLRRGFLLQNALSVSTIFIDRYLVLAYGLRYTAWKNRKKLFTIIAIKWVVGVVLVGAIVLFHSDFEDIGNAPIAKYISQYEDRGILPFPRIVLPAFLILFCTVSYLSSREIKKTVSFRKGLKGLDVKRFQDLKALKTVRYIIVCYAICFLPDITRSILLLTSVQIVEHWLVFSSFFFLLLTSAVNSVIYYIRTERFRRAFVMFVTNPLEKKDVFELKTYDQVVPKIVRQAKKLEQLEFGIDGPEDGTTEEIRTTDESTVFDSDQGCWDTKL